VAREIREVKEVKEVRVAKEAQFIICVDGLCWLCILTIAFKKTSIIEK
jgi:hypothetical protein